MAVLGGRKRLCVRESRSPENVCSVNWAFIALMLRRRLKVGYGSARFGGMPPGYRVEQIRRDVHAVNPTA